VIRFLASGFVVLALTTLASHASAQARVSEKTTYYSVNGKTGMDLLRDMNRKGPRHGFLTKAIAQTQFKSNLLGDIAWSKGVCVSRNGGYELKITYVYPKPSKALSPAMAKRWRAFHATNLQHEREHGRIARKMANVVARKVKAFREPDRPGCRRAMAKLGREVDAIIDAHNAEQAKFDAHEHRPGGPVERSVLALIKN